MDPISPAQPLALQEKAVKKERYSNFELLRIISMLLILSYHFSLYGGWTFSNTMSVNRAFILFLSLGGKLGVNIFVLISGYFLVNSRFKLQRLLKVVAAVFFYSVAYLLIFKIVVPGDVNTENIIKSFLPVTFSQYWFATAYVGMYAVSPFLNSIIRGLSFRRYVQLLAVILVLLSFVPPTAAGPIVGGNISWFVFLYFIAGFIRKYPMPVFEKKGAAFLGFGGAYLFMFLIALAFTWLGFDFSDFTKLTGPLESMNSLPELICSIFLFLGFKNIRLGSRHWINVIAGTTFGIYLLHENNFVRGYLWEKIFKTPPYTDSSLLIPFWAITMAIIFLSGSLIDLLREILFEKPLFGLIDQKCTECTDKLITFFQMSQRNLKLK